ncbi:MAG: SO_0444 family Cu/Zn efflux transporter [Gammaproteobacteria bacterium]|nr:SO_0444 family Cu/Zn efflux transporter [Gammaproteobacteria bacterium]
MLVELISNIWLVFLETAFWLLIGLLAAGVIKSFIAEDTMLRWVGGRGIGAISRAALFGAPLPLCSCGVLPAAIGLHRAGASKEATVSFLISTPETSVDSVAVTYALMGPVMAIFRPVAALVNAIGTGLLTTLVNDEVSVPSNRVESKREGAVTSCCSSVNNSVTPAQELAASACCEAEVKANEADCCAENETTSDKNRLMQVLSYAGAEMLDDIAKWMAIGIVLAGVMMTFIPPDWLAQWGQGFTAMLVMLVVGIPMYICAVASTPVAAGLLLAGVSPGAVLVFLLVGPATNIASFALLKQELGLKVTMVYLAGLSVLSLCMGLLLEWLLETQQWQIEAQLGDAHTMLPGTIAWLSAFLLIFLAIKPLRRAVVPQLG